MVLVIMGVSGSGKTTVGQILATTLGWPFIEGDSLHPQSNIEKMTHRIPLTDEDRKPWLVKVGSWVRQQIAVGECGVITCSALKRSYRVLIAATYGSSLKFVFLDVSRKEAAARLAGRRNHFMPSSLLDSQFVDLETPTLDEPAIRVDAKASPKAIASRILKQLGLRDRDAAVRL